MVTLALTVESQPKVEVWVISTVPVPGPAQSTLMEAPSFAPIILPPLTFQEYVSPATGVTEYTAILFSQVVSFGRTMTGLGVCMMVTLALTVESQPKEEVWVTSTVPAPGPAQSTLMEAPACAPIMLPPLTFRPAEALVAA